MHWLSDRVIRVLLALLLMLPYRRRVPLSGWLMAHLVAPIAGFGKRIRRNLALIYPDLPEAEVRRLVRAVPDNMGRSLIEMYSGPEFAARAAGTELRGPGVAHLEAAHREGRPVLLVTGHIGNYDAARAALIARGYRIGGLYKPMSNPFFNAHYVRAISSIGTPLFPRNRRGLADMVRFLRGGGIVGLVLDQYMSDGVPLDFLGHDAMTALSAAELALRYDALVLPAYSIRRASGLDFDMIFEEPVPHSTAEEMTQRLNHSLAAHVERHMDQWLWTHRRWKKS